MKNGTIPHKILRQLKRRRRSVFRRSELSGLGSVSAVNKALQRMAAAYQVEHVEHGLWRLLSQHEPRLVVPRTWSRPSGVAPDVLIANVLVKPSTRDLASVAHSYGFARLYRTLAQLKSAADIDPDAAETTEFTLRNIQGGMTKAYREQVVPLARLKEGKAQRGIPMA